MELIDFRVKGYGCVATYISTKKVRDDYEVIIRIPFSFQDTADGFIEKLLESLKVKEGG